MRNDIDELLQLSFTLSERRFGPLTFDPLSDQPGHGRQCIETIRRESFSSEHSHHADQPIANDEWIARKSDHALTFCPCPVTDARIIQNVIRQVGAAFLRNETDLQRTDWHPAVGSVQVPVHTGARLQFQRVAVFIDRPYARKRPIELPYDRLR